LFDVAYYAADAFTSNVEKNSKTAGLKHQNFAVEACRRALFTGRRLLTNAGALRAGPAPAVVPFKLTGTA